MVAKIVLLLLAGCAAVMAGPIDSAINSVQNVPQIASQVADRASDAVVQTYDKQKESIHGTLNGIKDLGQKGIESTVNLLRNGLEIIFFLPNLGRNFLSRKQQ